MTPWFLGFVDETIETLSHWRKEMGLRFQELMDDFRYTINDTRFVFRWKPVLGKTDNSAAGKASGVNVGGHKRCTSCDAPFDSNNVHKLFEYAEMSKREKKHMAAIAQIFREVSS